MINVEGYLCSKKYPGYVGGLLTSGESMHENSLVINSSIQAFSWPQIPVCNPTDVGVHIDGDHANLSVW